jgi:DNA-binding NarL/FixJ family response regulator
MSMAGMDQIVNSSELMEILRVPVEEAIRATSVTLDASVTDAAAMRPLNIGLIDCFRFSQECIMKAFDGLEPRPAIVPFRAVQDCISAALPCLDLIVYYSHETESSEKTIVADVIEIRRSFKTAPIIVLSDSEDAEQPTTIRSALKNGAQGFIPTRTTGIPITFAAIRLITAGGVFAPLDLLLTKRSERVIEMVRHKRLTPRQLAVLTHLQQGKANKNIAHELGMSESTVKVHVRNIMRKTGATNRTQAAYQARRLWGNGETIGLSKSGAT